MTNDSIVILLSAFAIFAVSYTAGFVAGAEAARSERLRSTCDISDISGLKASWFNPE